MATTDWNRVFDLQDSAPHTFNALQHLVMAMAGVVKYRGKKSLFGKDKGLIAYKEFEQKLRDLMLAMVLDGFIERNAQPPVVRQVICNAIGHFAEAFPNWQDAYSFADEYFIDNSRAAEERIQALLVMPE
jgi:hypothetical protein